MKQTGSNLVTKSGIAVLIALLFAAAYFRADTLMILLAAILAISIIAYAWTARSLARVTLRSDALCAEGFPGEDLSVTASLANAKLLPVIWLRLFVPAEPDAAVRPLNADGTIRSFLWVMPHQTITWKLTMHGERRGIWHSDSLQITGGDGFGLAEQTKQIAPGRPFEMVVFPALTEVNTAPLRRCVQDPEIVPRGSLEDTTLLRHTREYMFGDSARRINWRQTARAGEILVNVYETQEMRHIALALDTESFVYVEERKKEDGQTEMLRRLREEEFEETVSLLASAALDLLKHGLHVTLYQQNSRVSASNERDGRDILYALSLLDPVTEPGGLPDDAVFAYRHQDGPLFLFTNTYDERIGIWLDSCRAVSPHVICHDADSLEGGQQDPAVWSAGVLSG